MGEKASLVLLLYVDLELIQSTMDRRKTIHIDRNEKDLKELQNLINAHFKERETDEESYTSFKNKIDDRKAKRAGEIENRKAKETERAKQKQELLNKKRKINNILSLLKRNDTSKTVEKKTGPRPPKQDSKMRHFFLHRFTLRDTIKL